MTRYSARWSSAHWLLVATSVASAQQADRDFEREIAAPRTYRSDDLSRSLTIERKTLDSAAAWSFLDPGANYAMRSGEKTIWTRELPFTFVDARILGDGSTVGYSYETDLHGTRARAGKDEPVSRLFVTCVDPLGALKWDKQYPRGIANARMTNTPASPYVKSMIVNRDRLHLYLCVEDKPELWVFNAASGDKLDTIKISPFENGSVSLWIAQRLETSSLDVVVLSHFGERPAEPNEPPRRPVTEGGVAVQFYDSTGRLVAESRMPYVYGRLRDQTLQDFKPTIRTDDIFLPTPAGSMILRPVEEGGGWKVITEYRSRNDGK